ncbi:hypothetical protein CVS40_12157 [Lucilia cuprina]|nr:hypothetical protein CVS40_12157 [Lucilia cuprina]
MIFRHPSSTSNNTTVVMAAIGQASYFCYYSVHEYNLLNPPQVKADKASTAVGPCTAMKRLICLVLNFNGNIFPFDF